MNTAPVKITLKQQQQAFSELLRSEKSDAALSHIEERRLKVYQELFFNNIESLLANGFPVIRKILGETEWKILIKAFWKTHRCQTPYFPQIGTEFVRWLQQYSLPEALPFLRELAHYELMEVVVDTADISLPGLQGGVDDLRPETTLVLNPVSVILHYDYPVQRISLGFQPQEAGADKTRLLVYRNHQHQVKFMALSAATVILLDLLKTRPRSFLELAKITEQSLNAAAGSLQGLVEQQVRDFIEREIIFI